MGWLKGALFGKKKNTTEVEVKREEVVSPPRSIVISDLFERQKTSFTILPPEIFSVVISHMSPSALATMACTSKEYYFLFKPIIRELSRPATIAEFERLALIASGNFCRAYKVRFKRNNKIYALKVFSKKQTIQQNEIEHNMAQLEIMKKLNHPLLPKLYFAFQDADALYIVMDFYNGGELFEHLRTKTRFIEEEARFESNRQQLTLRFIVAEAVAELYFMHKNNIICRGVKPEDLVMDTDGHVHFIDFNLSKLLTDENSTTTFCGTPEYLSPEILRGDRHTTQVDWWAVGVLAYELVSGMPPFYDQDVQQMYIKILAANLVIPPYFSPELAQFCAKTLKADPNQRIGDEEIKQEPFFASIDWTKLENKEIPAPWKPPPADLDIANRDSPVEPYKPEGADPFANFSFTTINKNL